MWSRIKDPRSMFCKDASCSKLLEKICGLLALPSWPNSMASSRSWTGWFHLILSPERPWSYSLRMSRRKCIHTLAHWSYAHVHPHRHAHTHAHTHTHTHTHTHALIHIGYKNFSAIRNLELWVYSHRYTSTADICFIIKNAVHVCSLFSHRNTLAGAVN